MTADEETGESSVSPTSDRPESVPASEAGASGEFSPERRYRAAETALLVDAMLGKLCTYLRMCGYDAEYVESERGSADSRGRDALIRERACRESRTVLTRDRSPAAATEAVICLEARDIEAQLRELHSAGFELRLPPTPERCGTCNAELTRVSPAESTPDYAPAADEIDVYRCQACGQHFWKGSHWDDVAATMAEIR